eukprot:278620-Pyramimonas_sp.AAC.2
MRPSLHPVRTYINSVSGQIVVVRRSLHPVWAYSDSAVATFVMKFYMKTGHARGGVCVLLQISLTGTLVIADELREVGLHRLMSLDNWPLVENTSSIA